MFEQFQWSKTSKNNFIELYSSHKLNDIEKPILFIGGMHGDEPEGVNLALNLLDHLKNFTSSEHWALITCLNPDGHQTKQRTNGNGVDLNRNFPSPDWSDSYKKKRYYPGQAPNSEEETKALTQLIINIQPRIIIHFHSWKPSIILTGPKANIEAKLFSEASNYPLELDIGYPTPGSLGQYAWLSHSIPVICIEEAEGENSITSWERFKPVFESILNINK